MSDQCRNCTIRGDIKKCLETDCFQHEDWWAQTVLAQLSEAQGEIERMKSRTVCAYCGFEIEIDDEASSKISEHIKNCSKHPIRSYERHSEALQADNADLRNRLKPVEEVYKVLELSSEWQLIQAIKAACEVNK